MLKLICDRLSRRVFDDVMEVAWSTMWNVTDETAINCERFLEGRGMEYFLGCLHVSNIPTKQQHGRFNSMWIKTAVFCFVYQQCFSEKEELLRNMMGLVGNVAEVKRLRPRLMRSEFITEFSKLLDSQSDGIEVSWNQRVTIFSVCSQFIDFDHEIGEL